MCTFTYTAPTFITEAHHLVTQVQLLLTTVTVNLYSTGLQFPQCVSILSPCLLPCLTNHMEFISCHIMPLVINSLGAHTHTDTYTHTHTHTHKHTHTHTHIQTSAHKQFLETKHAPACVRTWFN